MKARMLQTGQRSAASLPPSLAYALMNDLSVGTLRSLAPLPDEAQRVIDQAVVRVGRQRLTVAMDLMDEGLTYNLPDALGTTEVYWELISESGGAHRAMNPNSRGINELQDRSGIRLPVYLTMDDFNLGIRLLRVSERAGQPIDTSQIEQCTRRVNEAIEDQAINGLPNVTFDGKSVYGLLTAPNANPIAYSSNEAWDAAGHDGEDILGDVSRMIDAAHQDRKYGPYNLYVPTSYGVKLDTVDFKANSDLTIRQRLEQIQAGGRNLRVRVADLMPANYTALVQMTSDVIDVVMGQAPIAIPWSSADGFTLHWLVMAIAIVRPKYDYELRSGIVKGYTT